MTEAPPPLLGIIAGPTASGKTALAVEVALAHGLAIISGDSMQVYRGMAVGTGAATPAEQRGVPHYLLGIADPAEPFHAARFLAEVEAARQHAWMTHGRRCVVVGGTGMWLQALREGLFDGPGRDESIRAELRARLDQAGAEALHGDLAMVDAAAAARLHPRDHVRVLRALEVHRLTGRAWSEWVAEDQARRAALGPLLPLYVIDRPREVLDERINARVVEMLANGWPEEARALAGLGLPEHSPARKALGYPELFRVLDGAITMAEATTRIQLATRQYARRQMTWFRGQRDAIFSAEPTPDHAAACLLGHSR